MMYKHYAPRCKTLLFGCERAEDALVAYRQEEKLGNRAAVLCEGSVARRLRRLGVKVLNLGENEQEMAANLYDLLRAAEKTIDVLVAVEPVKKDGIMAGVLNRLKKACASVDIPH